MPYETCWRRRCASEPVYTFVHGLLGVGSTCETHLRELRAIAGSLDLMPPARGTDHQSVHSPVGAEDGAPHDPGWGRDS